MRLTPSELLKEASEAGFQPDSFEKVVRLLELLEGIRAHPFLKSRVALKGGTAINLFAFDVPRLSVDIDLNYVGGSDRSMMIADKPKLEHAIQAVCSRQKLTVKRIPDDHAGGKWRLSYAMNNERSGTIELDVNFMLRTPLWPTELQNSKAIGRFRATQIPVLERHELAAGKLAALVARNVSRDLFDARELLRRGDFEQDKLRMAFVIYGGVNRKDWRTVSSSAIDADVREVDRQLVPMLRRDVAPSREKLREWVKRLVADCRDLLSIVLPLADNERKFIERLNDAGDILPELLTVDAALREIIRNHPGLKWKAINVKKHRGDKDAGADE